jgi:hypothetical protein
VVPVGEQDFAAHPQREQQPALGCLNLEPFAPGRDGEDLGAGQRFLERFHLHIEALGLEHLDPADGPADQFLLHISGEHDDFG